MYVGLSNDECFGALETACCWRRQIIWKQPTQHYSKQLLWISWWLKCLVSLENLKAQNKVNVFAKTNSIMWWRQANKRNSQSSYFSIKTTRVHIHCQSIAWTNSVTFHSFNTISCIFSWSASRSDILFLSKALVTWDVKNCFLDTVCEYSCPSDFESGELFFNSSK